MTHSLRSPTRSAFVAAVVAVWLALAALGSPRTAHAQEGSALFVNISTDDPWRVASAVFFAAQFGVKEGHPTTLFVTIGGVRMFTKDKAAVRVEEFGTTVHRMLRDYQSLGGKILVCKVCMEQLDIEAKDLIDGAELAVVKTTNPILFRPDTKIISW